MRIAAAILAAGHGSRFGGDKTQAQLGVKPVWKWSFDAYSAHPLVDRVLMVGSEENLAALSESGAAVLGGKSRQESSRKALEACGDAEFLLLHDAARPFVSGKLISGVIEYMVASGAAAAAVPVTDTIKEVGDHGVRTLDRSKLFAMQTPQGAATEHLRRAHAHAGPDATDDMAMLEAIGIQPILVPGDPANFKITTPEDLERARRQVSRGEVRTGIGYDVHPFGDDARPCILGGVTFEGVAGLSGHSDADVLLHAITDAILGAAALGDIGQHFPNTDERWRNKDSGHFLRHAAELVTAAGWTISNIDATVIAEAPKIMPRALEMRSNVAKAATLDIDRVSVKATTNERLGSIGRGEGVAAFAVCTLVR